MIRSRWSPMLAMVLFAVLPAAAQQQAYTNTDIANMIRANVPESTVLAEIDHLARTGQANFDISPQALATLRQQGVTEKILNAIMWAQTVPQMERPVVK